VVATRLIVGAATVAISVAILAGAGDRAPAHRITARFHSTPQTRLITRVEGFTPTPVRRVPVSAPPASLAWGYGALWALSGNDVLRIRTQPLRVRAFGAVSKPCENRQIATGLGGVWFVSGNCSEPGTLSELDPASGRVMWRVSMPTLLGGVAVPDHGDELLVTALNGGTGYPAFLVSRRTHDVTALEGIIDGPVGSGATTEGLSTVIDTPYGYWADSGGYGGVVRIVPEPPRLNAAAFYDNLEDVAVAFGHGAVWAGLGNQVLELDPDSGDEIGPRLAPPGVVTAVAYGANGVWIATGLGRLYRFAPGDPSLELVARLPWAATSLAIGGGYVWASNVSSGAIERVGPLLPA